MVRNISPTKIFIVEDDPIYTRLVKYVFELDPNHEIYIYTTGRECLEHLHLGPSIVSLDYSLPDMDGKKVMEKIHQIDKGIEVIILSGQNDISVAVQLLGNGAHDYIVKNEETKDRLLYSIERLRSNISLKKEVKVLKEELGHKFSVDKSIIGNSKPMQRVYNLVEKAIKTNISISITGETGSGKEVIAKNIHYSSTRKNGSFVAVNVSAIPKDLLESELFGYEKGAFTGADTQKIGQFELADQGTLFLDEIAEMDVLLQSKLLRAIQEREIMRVGGTSPIKFDTRIIVATHKNIAEEVEKGNFREDLYYRLLGLPIEVPPLRERGNDILLLTLYFLNKFCEDNNLGKKVISKEAKEKLLSYYYPGNVRELKAIIELSCVMAEGETIMPEDINFNSPRRFDSFLIKEMPLKEYNQKIINHFLERYNNDVLLVAKKLDIGKSTIYRMLKEKTLNE
ncbi:MAG: DNA-binding NtrC family response regulator [Saprospiraceae bacterium]|jgi:DNA-binding NtrC family response regulator